MVWFCPSGQVYCLFSSKALEYTEGHAFSRNGLWLLQAAGEAYSYVQQAAASLGFKEQFETQAD